MPRGQEVSLQTFLAVFLPPHFGSMMVFLSGQFGTEMTVFANESNRLEIISLSALKDCNKSFVPNSITDAGDRSNFLHESANVI